MTMKERYGIEKKSTRAGHVRDGGEGSAFGHGGASEELVIGVIVMVGGRIGDGEHEILRRI